MKMIEIMKRQVVIKCKEWDEEYIKTGKDMNLTREIIDLYGNIIISCTVGEEHTTTMVK